MLEMWQERPCRHFYCSSLFHPPTPPPPFTCVWPFEEVQYHILFRSFFFWKDVQYFNLFGSFFWKELWLACTEPAFCLRFFLEGGPIPQFVWKFFLERAVAGMHRASKIGCKIIRDSTIDAACQKERQQPCHVRECDMESSKWIFFERKNGEHHFSQFERGDLILVSPIPEVFSKHRRKRKPNSELLRSGGVRLWLRVGDGQRGRWGVPKARRLFTGWIFGTKKNPSQRPKKVEFQKLLM